MHTPTVGANYKRDDERMRIYSFIVRILDSGIMGKTTFCLVVLLAVLTIALAQEDLYSDAFDHIDVDHILMNDELRDHYYKCFMDTGPCETEDQKYFKMHAAEVFATQCRKCTEKQKENLAKVVEWYTKNRPEEWNTIVQKLIEEAKAKNIPVQF